MDSIPTLPKHGNSMSTLPGNPEISITFGSSETQEISFLVSLAVIKNGHASNIVLHRRAPSAVDALLDAVNQYFERYEIKKISVQPFRHQENIKVGASAATAS